MMTGALKFWDGTAWQFVGSGVAGPAGPAGPTGPQGPVGPGGFTLVYLASPAAYSAQAGQAIVVDYPGSPIVITLPKQPPANTMIRVVAMGTGGASLKSQAPDLLFDDLENSGTWNLIKGSSVILIYDATSQAWWPIDHGLSRLSSLATSLPAGASDGQEIYYQADATNGVIWNLRYRSASPNTSKWEFVGGSPLETRIETQESTNSTTFVALATPGPSVTVPLAGTYEVQIGVSCWNAAIGDLMMSYDIGATAAQVVDACANSQETTASAQRSVMTAKLQTLAAGTALVSKYRCSVATGSPQFRWRWMRVCPVRVGP